MWWSFWTGRWMCCSQPAAAPLFPLRWTRTSAHTTSYRWGNCSQLCLLIVSHQSLVSTTNILITVIIKQDISFFLLDNELGFLYRISHIIECLPRTSYVFCSKTCLSQAWVELTLILWNISDCQHKRQDRASVFQQFSLYEVTDPTGLLKLYFKYKVAATLMKSEQGIWIHYVGHQLNQNTCRHEQEATLTKWILITIISLLSHDI